jgi:transcriptional regulator with XRE-family HTH domain
VRFSTDKEEFVALARLDVGALYTALDRERAARKLSWRTLAKEVGISPSTLSRMANGHRPDVDAFAALTTWMGTSPRDYVVGQSDSPAPTPDVMTQLAPLLRARNDLKAEDVEYLEELIGAAVRRFRAERTGA